jgi:uncharacterized protein YjbI with pentapeptide repeats
MDTLTIRATVADLPILDAGELTAVRSLGEDGDRLSLFEFSEANLRTLELADAQLFDGRISAVTAERGHLHDLHLSSVEFSGCDLSQLRWENSRLSRVRFSNCKLLGVQLTGLSLDDVVFERCRLDYAELTDLQAKGAVIFTGCALPEATFDRCDLSGAAFDDCNLRATTFGPGVYKGTDLRGNDLSDLVGAINLKKTVIDRHQLTDLAAAWAADLDIALGDDH